ncbi:uncharacterized protein [Diadema antillarum]|uniref:uncharacterized protein n=1 Tax=Diadema antillarum TaxID=105358 RepID=UPI003A85BD4A
MAWFGGNLKSLTENLTGQISSVASTAASFTRDVIAEGTEEVADQTTELQIADGRVKRLETAVVALKAENERLGMINAELEEKAEASELQINSISSQYRSLLVEKEDQLNSLIQKQNDMQDLHHNMMSTAEGAMTTSTSTSSLTTSAIMADSHDFDDVISSQQEINRLSTEVARLRSECSHWKEVASVQQGAVKPMFQVGDDAQTGEVAQLKSKVKELEVKLRQKVDESQRQLSSLQDSHSHKLKTLTQRHKSEMESSQRRIESLEKMVGMGTQSASSSSDGAVVDDAQKRIQELEEILRETRLHVAQLEEGNHQLEKENARLMDSERDNLRLVQTLRRKVDALERDRPRQERDASGGQAGSGETAQEVAHLRKRNEELGQEVEHLMKVVNRQETELAVILGSHEQVREELYATKQRLLTELNASHASTSAMLEDIHDARRKLTSEDALRRSKLLREKQEIVNQMMGAGQKMSDSKNTVATLEAASEEIADQAAEIVSDIGCSQHQEITADFVHSLEKENDLLKHHVTKLQNEVDELNLSCETLVSDKEQCEELIVNLNQKVKELSQGTGKGLGGGAMAAGQKGRSDSEVTLAVTEGSDSTTTTNNPRHQGREDEVRQHIAYRRPPSPPDSSVASDVSSSMRDGWTSETELSSEEGFTEGKQSLQEYSDAVSFDGEFDDSIMFAGIKERFPEAANAFKAQLTQFEIVRADWEMEKQALEEVVIRMRDQLKEKDRIIQDMTAEKGLLAVQKEHEEDLQERLRSLEESNKSLLQEKETTGMNLSAMTTDLQEMKEEKCQLQLSLSSSEEAKSNLHQRVEELESKQSALDEELQMSRGKMEGELNSVREEKVKLQAKFEELENQHRATLTQMNSSRDNLIKEVREKEIEMSNMKDSLSKLTLEYDKAVTERAEMQSELEALQEDLSTSRADLLDSEQMKQEQTVAMTTLRTNLQAVQDEHDELLKSYRELQMASGRSGKELEQPLSHEGLRYGSATEDPHRIRDLEAQVQQLTSKLESSQAARDVDSPNENVAYLEHKLSRTNHEIEELNRSIDDRDMRVQELVLSNSEQQQLLEQQDAEIEAMKAENQRLRDDMKLKEEKLDSVSEELERMRVDIASSVGQREKTQEEEETKISQLEEVCSKLKNDLDAKGEQLDLTLESKRELEELVEQKEADISALAEENSHFLKNVEDSKHKIKDLRAKVKDQEDVVAQLQEAKKEIVTLRAELEDAELKLGSASSTETADVSNLSELAEKVEELQIELKHRDDAIRELSSKLHEQDPRITDDDGSEAERLLEDLKKKTGASDQLIGKLQSELAEKDQEQSALTEEIDLLKQNIASQENKLTEVNQILAMKEAEIETLKAKLETGETNEDSIIQFEKDLDEKRTTIAKLEDALSVSRGEYDALVQNFNDGLSEKEERMNELNNSVLELTNQKEAADKLVLDCKRDIEELQRTNQQKEEDIARLHKEVHNITTQLQQPPEQHLQNGEVGNGLDEVNGSDSIKDALVPSSPFGKSSSGMLQGQDGSISDNEKHYEKIIQEREKEIGMLQHERQVLLSSLNEKSTSAMGNSVLVDLHRNQMKVKTLESERHQMMSILNEKTREASNLKNEVHKLLKVISAQKSALEKAQEDVKELQRSSKGPRDDMQKEALQNLSRIIQDKDLEIEALKQKNNSLLEVLQSEAPSNSSQISGVLSESEKLQKENTVLKEERDQLVVSIHQKHQESLAYYEEVQRLVGVINNETQKHTALQTEHDVLTSQAEAQSKSLNQSMADLEETNKAKMSVEKELDETKQALSEVEEQLQELSSLRTDLLNKSSQLEEISASRDSSLAQKDSEIAELQRTIDELHRRSEPVVEEVIVRKENVPLQQSSPPGEYEQVLKDKDAQIADLKLQLQSSTAAPTESVDSSKVEHANEEIVRLKEELESQGHALLEMDSLARDRSSELEKRKEEIAVLKQQVDQHGQAVLERDAIIQQRNSQLQQIHQDLQARTEEANTLRQHVQQLSLRLQGIEQELAKSQQELTSSQHLMHNKDGELRQLQDLMNRIGAEVREKDFELGALQEKCKTLTKLLDEKESDTQGEVRKILGEAEAMQTQAQRFQHERDQALLALEKCQGDLAQLQHEVQTRGTNEQKLMRELERLRNHLIQMEDTYTQEALQAEEREKELRNRLSLAEEHAHTSSTAVQSASKEANAQIENLLDQLTAVTEQKDKALMQLAMAQEESQQYILSLSNLQVVLEQFQQEKEASIAAEVEVYQLRAREKERIAGDLLKQNVELQERLSSAQEALDVASRLSEQLDKKEEALEKMRSDMHKKDDILAEFQKRFEEVSNTNETKVDKPLVKNLFMNYVAAPQGKKEEVVKLISNVLNFSPEDMQKVGLSSSSGGWLSGFFRRTPTHTPPATPTKANTSFTRQFVEFLEIESTPKRSPRLPVDEMTQDRPRSSYNPFSAPVPQQSPFIQPGTPGAANSKGPGAAHPFLKATGQPATPIGALQPVIKAAGMPTNPLIGATPTTLAGVPTTFTPVPVRDGAGSGRGSPRNQAKGLGDLLQ